MTVGFPKLTTPEGEKHEGSGNTKKEADQEAAGLVLQSILSNDRQKIVEFVKEMIFEIILNSKDFDILVDLKKTVLFTVYEKNCHKAAYKNLDEYIQGISTKIYNDMKDIKVEDFDTNLYIRILFPCLDLIHAQALERFENKFRRFVGLQEI